MSDISRSAVGGMTLELAIDACDANGADRAFKGDGGDRESGGGADHREDIGIVLPVGGEHEDLDEHFVKVAEGEERADGPINHACGEGFLGGGAAFALDESAGELACGGGLFTVIDGEGEEVRARDEDRRRRPLRG